MKLYLSKAWLQGQLRKKTVNQIAKECGVDVSTINRQIQKHGIR